MMVYAIACYIAGLLVFPFFFTFATRRSVVDPDEPILLVVSVFWPIYLVIALTLWWWGVMVALGERTRGQFDQAYKDFKRWIRES